MNYSIVGGADAAFFTIDNLSGTLSFLAAPDFEAPADAGTDNVYDVTVQVDDGARWDRHAGDRGHRHQRGEPPVGSHPTAAAPRRASTPPRTRPSSLRSRAPTSMVVHRTIRSPVEPTPRCSQSTQCRAC
ncbi:MAG: cadherin repeat domain-containing protein [Burkholderiaceae bacterium]